MESRAVLVFCLVLAGTAFSFDSIRWLVRTPDVLTPEQRRAMDSRLFNELKVRKKSWKGRTREMRVRLVESMAEKGIETADLALRLLDVRPGSWGMPLDRNAYRRLKKNVSAGDASAKCLMVLVNKKWRRETQRTEDSLVTQAAAEGHPTCLMYKAGMVAASGEIDRAHRLYKEAAKGGSHPAQLWLVSSYAQGIRGYPLNIGKARCWFTIAQYPEFDTGESSSYQPVLARWIREAKERGVEDVTTYSPKSWCEREE